MESSLFLKRISPSATPIALASSGLPTLRHSQTSRSSNSFVSYHIPLSRVFSSDCALFSATARAQLLSFQKLAHSFYRDGCGTPHSEHPTTLSFAVPLFSQRYELLSRKHLVSQTIQNARGWWGGTAQFSSSVLSVSPSQIPIPSAAPASDQSSPPATPARRKPRRPPAATTSPRPAT